MFETGQPPPLMQVWAVPIDGDDCSLRLQQVAVLFDDPATMDGVDLVAQSCNTQSTTIGLGRVAFCVMGATNPHVPLPSLDSTPPARSAPSGWRWAPGLWAPSSGPLPRPPFTTGYTATADAQRPSRRNANRRPRAPSRPMLGYHNTHTAWLVAAAGGTWSRYAPVTITNGDDPLSQDEALRPVDYVSSPASQANFAGARWRRR